MQTLKYKKSLNTSIQQLIITIIDFFHSPFKQLIPQQLFRYGVCGGINLLFDWVLFYIFFHFIFREQIIQILPYLAFEPHIASFFFTFPITFISGFWLQKYVSFNNSILRGRVQIFRYLLVVLSNILFIYIMLKLFVEIFHFYPTPSKMLATIITTIYSYLMQKYFSFK